jgi:PAS domain-containing protein
VSARQPAITIHGRSNMQTEDAYPFWLLFDGSSTCIAQLDLQFRVVGGNSGFAEAFGLEIGILPGYGITELVHSSVREKLSWQLRSLVRGERSRFTDRVLAALRSSAANLEITGISVTNDAGRVESLIILVQQERAEAKGAEGVEPVRPAKARKPLTKMDAGVLEGVASGMSTVQLADEEAQGGQSFGARIESVRRRTVQHRHLAAQGDYRIHRVTRLGEIS